MHLRHFVKPCCKAVKEKVDISTDFYFLMAVAIILVPVQWMGAWLLAISVHELCHYISLKACGGKVKGICISCKGVIMQTEPLPLEKEAVCAYAGPLGALLILLIARYLPRTAICTIVFSAYNLLPIFPLDGGRGLGCLLHKFFHEERANAIQKYIENGVLFCTLLIAVYSVFRLGLGLFPAAVVIFLFWRSKGIKFPCKKCRLGLQ